jgi:putative flippase GtrA
MTDHFPRIVTAARRKLHTTVGKRFSRFAVAAAAAVAASQTTLAVCLGYFRLPAGRSALAAWVAGAGTSYLVSRWAWERKGRPHLLKETLPFWVVAVGAAIVLTSTTKFANHRAVSMGLSHTQVVLFDAVAFFVANCVTFLTRFLIFHYVIFSDRRSRLVPSGTAATGRTGTEPSPIVSGSPVQVNGSPVQVSGSPVQVSGSPVQVSGRSAGVAGAAGQSQPIHAANESGTPPEQGSPR